MNEVFGVCWSGEFTDYIYKSITTHDFTVQTSNNMSGSIIIWWRDSPLDDEE